MFTKDEEEEEKNEEKKKKILHLLLEPSSRSVLLSVLDILTLEDKPDRLFRNVGFKAPLLHVITQKTKEFS
jgi:hypothetical protein